MKNSKSAWFKIILCILVYCITEPILSAQLLQIGTSLSWAWYTCGTMVISIGYTCMFYLVYKSVKPEIEHTKIYNKVLDIIFFINEKL